MHNVAKMVNAIAVGWDEDRYKKSSVDTLQVQILPLCYLILKHIDANDIY